MKPGRRALGVAESYRGETSTLAGAVVRADRVVEGFGFATCTVGGTDATAAIERVWDGVDRPDVSYLLVAGVALAWYNLVDLQRLHRAIDRPVLAVSFEASSGLSAALRAEFEGEALERRLCRYASLPSRRPVATDAGELYVRHVGLDAATADRVVRAYTHEGRPEPLRVAKQAARAVDTFRRS